MEKAKQAVSDFMKKSGHHDTEVHERVAPAVEHKTISPEHREERQVAVDKEIHQDHYHTSVQPVKDREVLPEQHHENFVPVEHRKHDHANKEETENRLRKEREQFKDETVKAETHRTSHEAPTVGGEHVHHHIHETIQPVVQKETIEPHVTHTVVPVHEVHQNAAQHHSASALPPVSMDDFKKQGGALGGREERVDRFDGEPRSIERSLEHERSEPRLRQDMGRDGLGREGVGREGLLGREGEREGVGREDSGMRREGMDREYEEGREGKEKPSMMNKLNPKKDADGDGKAGFMS